MEDRKLRVLIVDDEPGMRLILRKLVERAEGYEVAGEAADGAEGVLKFAELRPEVVFLDVDMPVLDGVSAARKMQDMDPRAALLFATAHEGYREEAFAVYAFDYLVKPFRNERVLETLARIRALKTAPAPLPVRPALPQKRPGRLMLKTKEGVTFLDIEDILLIQRENRQTVIYTAEGAFPTGDSLSDLEEKLDPARFFRSHKSYIINLEHIRSITPYGRWTYVVQLDGTAQDALITHERYEELERLFE